MPFKTVLTGVHTVGRIYTWHVKWNGLNAYKQTQN